MMFYALILIIGAIAVVFLPRIGARDNTQISVAPVAVFLAGALLLILAWPYIAPALLPLYLAIIH